MKDFDKSYYRKLVKERFASHSSIDLLKRSENLCARIETHPEFKTAQTVMIYWSLNDEVDTQLFIEKWHMNKTILLPAIRENDIIPMQFESIHNMKPGLYHHIPEPVGDIFNETIDMIIVPGRAFDIDNNRLGRGKGYYDRLIKKLNVFTLGLCFDFQLFDQIPNNDNDARVNEVMMG